MSHEEIGRLGMASVIAAIGAGVQIQLEFCEQLSAAPIYWWLLMLVGCGVTLDVTQGSSKLILLVSSLVASSAFVGVCLFMSAVDTSNALCFSGISAKHPGFYPLMLSIWLISTAGCFLLSFSRPLLTKVIAIAMNNQTAAQIHAVEKSVRAVVSLLAAIGLSVGIATA